MRFKPGNGGTGNKKKSKLQFCPYHSFPNPLSTHPPGHHPQSITTSTAAPPPPNKITTDWNLHFAMLTMLIVQQIWKSQASTNRFRQKRKEDAKNQIGSWGRKRMIMDRTSDLIFMVAMTLLNYMWKSAIGYMPPET